MTKNKTFIGIIVAVVLAFAAIVFGVNTSNIAGTGSPTGATWSTSKVALQSFTGVTIAPNTVVASFYNSDATDRVISSVDGYIGSLTSPAVTLYVATSTSATATTTTQYIVNGLVLGTSGNLYLASTTPSGVTADNQRIWPAGTYLDVVTSTTTTATGVIGVKYFSL